MPCNDGVGPEYVDSYQRRIDQRRIDKLTRMLCSVCKEIDDLFDAEEGKTFIKGIKGLSEWWEEHKQIDAQRLETEREQKRLRKLRKTALAKLTTEERQLLGL